MLNRVKEILIGKDISRDAAVIAGANMTTIQASGALGDGEIVALDKNMNVLAAGATVADSDVIYLAQGTGSTFSITTEAGVTTTGNRRIILSKPIEAKNVKSYLGVAYTAKGEHSWLLDLDDVSDTITSGVEYKLRIVYSDIKEYPTRFTQSYRVDNVATEGALIYALAQKINKHKDARVIAYCYQSDGATEATSGANANQLKLVGKEIPSCTTGTSDIDKFSQVVFDVFVNYVDSDGYTQTLWSEDDASVTNVVSGNGNWEQIRDAEKWAMGYAGVSNFTHFPVITPDFRTVVDATYNQIIIEHNPSHLSPYPSDKATDPVTTIVAIPVESSGTQMTSLLAQLNPWFASCPGAFANISF